MKTAIGNVLLVLGTCFAGLGAANSERASRELPLPASGGLEGQYLFDDVGDPEEPAYARGSEVTAEVVAHLRAAGADSVLVRNPPRGAENVSLDRAEGRVLDAPAGDFAAERFLEAAAVEELRRAGVTSVSVRIARQFTFAGWEERGLFVAGILVMIAGVALKRLGGGLEVVRGDGTSVGPEDMRTALATLGERVEQLAGRVDGLDCDAIHTALDPLFLEYGQPFVENREVLRRAFGGAVFANVLAPFASAERRLNRAWSAAVDGYVEEARLSVHAAVEPLAEAREAFPRA